MADTRRYSGGGYPNTEYLVTVDPLTMSGDGTTKNPITALAQPATIDPWIRRTQIALTFLFSQLQASANNNVLAGGQAGAAVLGNACDAGENNNLLSNRNPGDHNTAGAIFGPVIFIGTANGELSGLVSGDNDPNFGFSSGFFFSNAPYGVGACVVQNGMKKGGVFTLRNQSNKSLPANRLMLPNSVDLIMPFGASALFLFQIGDVQRWELQE